MAYNLKRINTIDLRPSTGVGVSIPFNNPSVFTTVYTTSEQLKYNIINYLLTDKGERIFNPTFGAGIRTSLFEQITVDASEALTTTLRSGLEYNFPGIIIAELNVDPDPNNNLIYINISYTIRRNNETDTITLNIQNG